MHAAATIRIPSLLCLGEYVLPHLCSVESNPTVNWLVSVLYAVCAFWVPFHHSLHARSRACSIRCTTPPASSFTRSLPFPCTRILTLRWMSLVLVLFCNAHPTGFSLKRWYLPFVYAVLNYFIDGTIVCVVFPILWGILYVQLNKVGNGYCHQKQKDTPFKRALLSVMKRMCALPDTPHAVENRSLG